MITGLLHGGPRDGETVDLPWGRLEMDLPRWTGDFMADATADKYRLRPPWRGQSLAHYDYQES